MEGFPMGGNVRRQRQHRRTEHRRRKLESVDRWFKVGFGLISMLTMVLIAWVGQIVIGRNSVVKWTHENEELAGPCTIPREEDLGCEAFVERYLNKQPVVLRNGRLENAQFIRESSLEQMRTKHGDLELKLSTANSYTGREWTEMRMREYLDQLLRPQDVEKQGNQTYYLFGSQYGVAWSQFLSGYKPPTSAYPSETIVKRVFGRAAMTLSARQICQGALSRGTEQDMIALSFGIASRGTGVPFHFGPGFLQMLHGRKRWFLYPPKSAIEFHPNETTLHWVRNVYPFMDGHTKPTHECVLSPGDVIYFPDEWMHATLNLDNYTCFMATFA